MATLSSNIQLNISEEQLVNVLPADSDTIEILTASDTYYSYSTGTEYTAYLSGIGLNSFIARIDSFGIESNNSNNFMNLTGLDRYVTAYTIESALEPLNLLNDNDIINGSSFNDTIHGFGGNDTIDGGAGTDTVVFFGTKSRYNVTQADGFVTVKDNGFLSGDTKFDGTDTLRNVEILQFQDGIIEVNRAFTNIDPTLNQSIVGASGNDVISVGSGDDTLLGGFGADTITGGDGADHIYGEQNNDFLQGNQGHDNIHGGSSNDTVYGGQGNDYVQGNIGADFVNGNRGNDTVLGGKDADIVYGGQNEDYVNGNFGNDTVLGNKGHDTIRGGQGDDLLMGGEHNDGLYGDKGNDTLAGGSGEDGFFFNNIEEIGNDVIIDFEHNIDKLYISSTWYQNNENVVNAFNDDNILEFGTEGSVTLDGISTLSTTDIILI